MKMTDNIETIKFIHVFKNKIVSTDIFISCSFCHYFHVQKMEKAKSMLMYA